MATNVATKRTIPVAKYVRAEDAASRWRKLSEWLLGILAVLGFLIGLLTLWPRITVDPSDYYFDPKVPSLISFRVTNTGITQLRSVKTALGLCSIDYRGGRGMKSEKCDNFGPLHTRLVRTPNIIRKVSMDEKFNYRLDDFIVTPGAEVDFADVSVIVSFTAYGAWWTSEREFRFQTKKEGDGRLSWQPQPLEK